MTDFKVGDLVQIDPALVNGGARKSKGVGRVSALRAGGTQALISSWAVNDTVSDWEYTRDLVLVSSGTEDHQHL